MNRRVHKPVAVTSLVACTMLSAGCATSRVAFGPNTLPRLRHAGTIHVIRSKPPSRHPQVITATGVATTFILGPVLGTLSGAAIHEVREGPIPDPASKIQEHIARFLAAKYALDNIEVHGTSWDPQQETPRAFADASTDDLLLSVQTRAWSLTYLPLAWSRYRLNYSVIASLQSSGDGETLWRSSCVLLEPSDTASKMKELTANGGALLRTKLTDAAQTCAAQLTKSLGE